MVVTIIQKIKTMKRIYILFLLTFLLGMLSCQNEEWEFPDFEYSTVYFPHQYPVRTLILGDYEYDNENDKNLKFLISAHLGGMYENKSEQTVTFAIDEALAQNLKTDNGDTLKLLPSSYYTINDVDQIIIPQGEFHSGFEVQLNESFLNDTMSHKTHYVLPVRIITSSLDSILRGKSTIENADLRVPGHWEVSPKDYTIFGIKYINPYHGKYLHRGIFIISDATNTPIDTIVYRQDFVEKDEIWHLQTISRNSVTVKGAIRSSAGSPGELLMDITFNDAENGVITENPLSVFPITGTAKFVTNGDNWGGKDHNAIYLDYTINVNQDIHSIKDTLVIRDRDVRFETFNPVVVQNQ